ncbi:hypothetical protein D3C78_1174430 [compost metagenome]
MLLSLRQNGGLGRPQHALHAPQQGERQDDAAVLRLLEIAAQQVGDGPEEGGGLGVIFRVHGGESLVGQNAEFTPTGLLAEHPVGIRIAAL